jgi:hypothetical protein
LPNRDATQHIENHFSWEDYQFADKERFKFELAEEASLNRKPEFLIAKLKEHHFIKNLLESDARVMFASYSIETHVLLGKYQDAKYHNNSFPNQILTKAEYDIIFALHDIGKPIPPSASEQHQVTSLLFNKFRDFLPIRDEVWPTALFLVSSDVVGTLIKSSRVAKPSKDLIQQMVSLSKETTLTIQDLMEYSSHTRYDLRLAEQNGLVRNAAQELNQAARSTKVSSFDLFDLVCYFFRNDTMAYLYDAEISGGHRSHPALEHIYELNPHFSISNNIPLLVTDKFSGLVKFHPEVRAILEAVRNLLA